MKRRVSVFKFEEKMSDGTKLIIVKDIVDIKQKLQRLHWENRNGSFGEIFHQKEVLVHKDKN